MRIRDNSTPYYYQNIIIGIGFFVCFFRLEYGLGIIVLGVILILLEKRTKDKEIRTAKEKLKINQNFEFTISAAEPTINECKKGEELNHWVPDDKSKIIFYKRGYYGGDGKVGEVPSSLTSDIIKFKEQGNEIKFFIYGTEIAVQINSKENLRKEKIIANLKKSEELNQIFDKKYQPRNDIELRVQHSLNTRIGKNREVELIIEDKDYFLQYPDPLYIEFRIPHHNAVIRKDNEEQKIIRVLRAYYQKNYSISVRIKESQLTNIDFLISFERV